VEELERRRRRAIALVLEGHSKVEAAQRVGAKPASVTRWWQAYEAKGEAGLSAVRHPGPKPKLSAYQRKLLANRLLKGAQANGFATNLWTGPRIVELIERRYGVRYHVDHIPRLMASLGWSCQKPERRAIERDESAIQTWVSKDWPRIKKRRT
jgi:transposase